MKKLLGILLVGLFLALPLAGDWYWNKYTGKLDYYEKSTASPWYTTLYLYDLDLSNKLAISWPENDVADRTLRFYINGGARVINLSGDFVLSGANQVGLWTVTSTLLQSANQYHNFGGVAGAGGYGFRDNAGTMQFKDSGGAWTNFLVAAGAHNFLSSTHTDTVAASPILGDILYGNVTPAWTKLAGNTTAAKQYLTQTGTGAVSAIPSWTAIPTADAAKTDITASFTWDNGWHNVDLTAVTSATAMWAILSIYVLRAADYLEDIMFGNTGCVADANAWARFGSTNLSPYVYGSIAWIPLDVNQIVAYHCPGSTTAKFIKILGWQ